MGTNVSFSHVQVSLIANSQHKMQVFVECTRNVVIIGGKTCQGRRLLKCKVFIQFERHRDKVRDTKARRTKSLTFIITPSSVPAPGCTSRERCLQNHQLCHHRAFANCPHVSGIRVCCASPIGQISTLLVVIQCCRDCDTSTMMTTPRFVP